MNNLEKNFCQTPITTFWKQMIISTPFMHQKMVVLAKKYLPFIVYKRMDM